jgi:hypothetical protein
MRGVVLSVQDTDLWRIWLPKGTVDLDIVIRIAGVDTLCHEDDDDSGCQECLALLDGHYTPLKVLAGSDGTHLARWCNLEVYNGMGLGTQQMHGSGVSFLPSSMVARRPDCTLFRSRADSTYAYPSLPCVPIHFATSTNQRAHLSSISM